MIEEVIKDSGLWCLINNAGIGHGGLIEWTFAEDFSRVMDVNLWGHVNVTKAMLPFLKRARGRIINMTSLAGRSYSSGMSAYCMSKHAFEAFSDSSL